MATLTQHSIAHGSFEPAHGLRSWLTRRLAQWVEKRRANRDMQDLAAFSDRELWDLGLSRSDLMAVERGTYTRDSQ
jgi:uncharacterized protein YjiS (DUF1127 family)